VDPLKQNFIFDFIKEAFKPVCERYAQVEDKSSSIPHLIDTLHRSASLSLLVRSSATKNLLASRVLRIYIKTK